MIFQSKFPYYCSTLISSEPLILFKYQNWEIVVPTSKIKNQSQMCTVSSLFTITYGGTHLSNEEGTTKSWIYWEDPDPPELALVQVSNIYISTLYSPPCSNLQLNSGVLWDLVWSSSHFIFINKRP